MTEREQKLILSLAILPRSLALHAREELGEGRGIGKMETIGYLADGELGGAQKEGCLHEEHLVDIVYDCAPRNLTHYSREIDIGDVELGGIETYVVMLGKVEGKETLEAYEDFLHTLRNLIEGVVRLQHSVDYSVLHVLQVKKKDGIKHLKYLNLIDMIGVEVGDNLTQFRVESLSSLRDETDDGLMQLHQRLVCHVYKIVYCRGLDGCVFINRECYALIVL